MADRCGGDECRAIVTKDGEELLNRAMIDAPRQRVVEERMAATPTGWLPDYAGARVPRARWRCAAAAVRGEFLGGVATIEIAIEALKLAAVPHAGPCRRGSADLLMRALRRRVRACPKRCACTSSPGDRVARGRGPRSRWVVRRVRDLSHLIVFSLPRSQRCSDRESLLLSYIADQRDSREAPDMTLII